MTISNPQLVFITSIKEKIHLAQYEALKEVNTQLIRLYWKICKYISQKVVGNRWGNRKILVFFCYIQIHYPDIKKNSPSNLWRMRQFFETYENIPKLAPLARELTRSNTLYQGNH
jgi:hypothetical protein